MTAEEIAWARRSWKWDLGNRVLYDLCRNHPAHENAEEVIAKVWLIGRSYAAAIERRRRGWSESQIGDDFYEETVAPKMMGSGIDAWIADASRTSDPGSRAAVVAHGKLTALFEKMTGQQKRSLASKYLHFHSPNAFFIYDSRARDAIAKVTPRPRSTPHSDAPEGDKEYRNFTRRCVWLREHVRCSSRICLTPREIDKLLLKIADDERRARRAGPPG